MIPTAERGVDDPAGMRVSPSLPVPVSIPTSASGHRGFLLVGLFFLGALAFWFFLDHSWPSHDAAGHIRDAQQYKVLLQHPQFWKTAWLEKFFTVNYNYPPTLHIFNGLLKVAFGDGLSVDRLSLCLFASLLNVTVYATALLLFDSRRAGVLAVIFVNCYYLTAFLSHITMLDFPHLSLYSLAMLSFVWWAKSPGWRRAVLLGLCLGIDATSKQVAIFYLVGPGVLLLFQSLRQKRMAEVRQLLLSAFICFGIFLVWPLPNLPAILAYMGRNSSSIGGSSFVADVFWHHLGGYLSSLPEMMSPLLLAVGLVCAAAARRAWGRMAPFIASALVGVTLMSVLPFQLPEPRYIVPVLVGAALVSGYQLSRWLAQSPPGKWAVSSVVALALVQFVIFNFTPYPLPLSLAHNVSALIMPGANDTFRFPTEGGDPWKQVWVVDTIESVERGRPCYLNVVPNTTEINVHTYELICSMRGSRVSPTTMRLWTPLGDSLSFSSKSMPYFDWFLAKTGDQGLKLRDAASEQASRKIIASLQDCRRFKLFGVSPLPDGSELQLYRRLP